MLITINRQNDGFQKKSPSWGRFPFHVGGAAEPSAGDFVFTPIGAQGNERERIDALLAERGLHIGQLMGGHEYEIIAM